MEGSEERLERIRQATRRQKAEDQQRELAANRPPRNSRKINFGWPYVWAMLLLVVGALYVYGSREQPQDKANRWQLGRDIESLHVKAAQQAGIRYLAGQGFDINTIDSITAEEMDGGRLYQITMLTGNRTQTLTAHLTCQNDELNVKDRMQPDCYTWR